ncbi:Imm43 family immunity protein [Hyalangium minutum]|uniref:Immunity MXAN-0049 protein domain-containing protein n=1 Tax=Hyalangium minutum TaxID=394096 RepID=A0A085WSB3_9BACT|nr:DUF1629 domain-containing protein [Hyalangium minutum]KFE70576.1 hypothetical protein DB31_5618 [Hyalangium minutum]
MAYWILKVPNQGAVLGGFPRSKIKAWRYGKGERLAKEFPKNAAVQFADKFKSRRELFDFVFNFDDALYVSSKVRAILEQLETPELEFLPVSIKDHKGAVAAKDYFILNPVGTQDIIDMKKSDVVMDSLIEGEISRIKKLVLQPKAVDKGAHLFRATNMPDLIVIDDKVRTAFEKQGVTNYQLFKAEGWDGLELGGAEFDDPDGGITF